MKLMIENVEYSFELRDTDPLSIAVYHDSLSQLVGYIQLDGGRVKEPPPRNSDSGPLGVKLSQLRFSYVIRTATGDLEIVVHREGSTVYFDDTWHARQLITDGHMDVLRQYGVDFPLTNYILVQSDVAMAYTVQTIKRAPR